VMEIVSKFTKEIYINMNNGQFMTLNYLRWYDDTRTLSFAGAGHEHVLWFHKGTGRSEKIRTGGLAAGLVDNADDYIKQNNLQLENGDVVLLYTDGVTEARNTGKEMFTINRLQAALESYAYLLHPEKIRDLIIKDIYGFMGSEEQYDDITLLVLSVAGQEKTHTATVKALEPENASV